MAGRVCRFISDRSAGGNPREEIAEEIYERYIQPVVTSNFPDFTVHLFRYQDTPGLSEPFLEDILEMDLVIADITQLNQHAYFELGVRQQSGKPLILIADEEHTVPLRPTDLSFVPYRYDPDNGFIEDETAAADLVNAISTALEEEHIISAPKTIKPTKQSLGRLVDRLNEAAQAIRDTRINSAAETASEIEQIAIELSMAADGKAKQAMDAAVDAFLDVLTRLAGQLASVRGSRMLISGAIAVVLGGGTVSGVTAFGLSLAFWEGKETFLKAIERYSRGRQSGKD